MSNKFEKLKSFGKDGLPFMVLPENHSGSSLYQYYKFVRNYQPIDAKTQIEYILKYREKGDKYYRDAVILSNQKMVIALVNRTCKHKSLYADFIQTANYALCVAFDMYDPSFNVLFFTYASSRVLHELYNLEITYYENKKANKHIRRITNNIILYLNKCFSDNRIPTYTDIQLNVEGLSKNMMRITKPIIECAVNDFLYNHNFRITQEYINRFLEKNDNSWIDTGISSYYKQIAYDNIHDNSYKKIQNNSTIDLLIRVISENSKITDAEIRNIKSWLSNEEYDKVLLSATLKTIKNDKKTMLSIKKIINL